MLLSSFNAFVAYCDLTASSVPLYLRLSLALCVVECMYACLCVCVCVCEREHNLALRVRICFMLLLLLLLGFVCSTALNGGPHSDAGSDADVSARLA